MSILDIEYSTTIMPRGPRTPLALAVLELLAERPMHPYELQQQLHLRGLHHYINVKESSLYSTVDRLAGAGFIDPVETNRTGRRPERTVYSITEAGRDELHYWLPELLVQPANEYPRFAAALAFITTLPVADVPPLLDRRAMIVEAQIAAAESVLQTLRRNGLPRAYLIEAEYTLALQRAELDWIRSLQSDLELGRIPWPDVPAKDQPYPYVKRSADESTILQEE